MGACIGEWLTASCGFSLNLGSEWRVEEAGEVIAQEGTECQQRIQAALDGFNGSFYFILLACERDDS